MLAKTHKIWQNIKLANQCLPKEDIMQAFSVVESIMEGEKEVKNGKRGQENSA
jgi:hypothetical protein